MLNPSALVLGGMVMEGCPTLLGWTQEVLRERVLAVAGEVLVILPAELGDDAGIIGAASLVMAENPV
jgi:glucokinase